MKATGTSIGHRILRARAFARERWTRTARRDESSFHDYTSNDCDLKPSVQMYTDNKVMEQEYIDGKGKQQPMPPESACDEPTETLPGETCVSRSSSLDLLLHDEGTFENGSARLRSDISQVEDRTPASSQEQVHSRLMAFYRYHMKRPPLYAKMDHEMVAAASTWASERMSTCSKRCITRPGFPESHFHSCFVGRAKRGRLDPDRKDEHSGPDHPDYLAELKQMGISTTWEHDWKNTGETS